MSLARKRDRRSMPSRHGSILTCRSHTCLSPGVIGFLAVLAALRLVRLPGRASIRLAILAVNLVVATLLAYLLYLATW